MNNKNNFYKETAFYKIIRWLFVIVNIGLIIFVMPEWIKGTINDYYNQNWKDFFFGMLLILVLPVLGYMIIDVLIEFFIVAVRVELKDDKIIGYPWYGKKKYEMSYKDIEIIKDRSNAIPHYAITLLSKNKKMFISVMVYPLAELIEEIEKRAVNLKENNLESLKLNKSLWLYGKEKKEKSN